MKKKWLLGALMVSMLAFTGCSNGSTTQASGQPSVTASETTSEEQETIAETVSESESEERQTASEPQEVVIYLTRHGKTMFNNVGRAQGWSDTPLIESGVEVAEQLGKGLKKKGIEFVAAYSSDSGRARETADIVLNNSGQGNLEYAEDRRLRETCFGTFEGDYDENMWAAAAVVAGYEDSEAMLADDDFSLDDMYAAVKGADESKMAEDLTEVKARMRTVLREIAEETAQNGGGNVLVVSHGCAIMAVVSDLRGEAEAEFIPVGNASVTKIIYKDGQFEIEYVGNLDYVEAGAVE